VVKLVLGEEIEALAVLAAVAVTVQQAAQPSLIAAG
jgi:hypothetical protein